MKLLKWLFHRQAALRAMTERQARDAVAPVKRIDVFPAD